ncbi:MFS transporter [Sporolituus thermophilus]|uniref:Sugar phosphate permease n=1 Tax=Sporolituus thermophilus DSM 23256 TaxID=1123285 RepID=A0A1G7HPI0_9FIRM|nr:MFS transporter [Sporolituus thermophilus]SDF02387.1 Sugar phosphate permease [Sporolituus thermophilus DSM 23256]
MITTAIMQEYHRRRWLIWLPLALAFLTPYFHRTVMGVVTDNLMRDFAIERASEMGNLASIYFYTYAVMQLPAGILTDRFGPRLIVTAALVTASLGAFFFSWSGSIAGLYAGRFFASLGVSLIYVSIVKIHAEWFRLREFGTMTGLIVVAGSAGFLLSATPLAYVVDAFGWRTAFVLIGCYSMLMAGFCWLMVRDRPVDVGLPSLAEIEGIERDAGSQQVNGRSGIGRALKTVLGNPHTWWPVLAAVAIYGVYMAFMGIWAVPYFMQVYGMPRTEAANYIMAMALGTMVGGPLLGVISDRLGLRRGPYIWNTVFFLAVWLVLTVWNGGKPPVWALYPLCFGIGLGVSGVNMAVACTKEVNPPELTGIAAGVGNSGGFVGAALMQPAFGWVLDRQWQGAMEHGVRIYSQQAFQVAFGGCALVLVLGLLCTLMIKETGCRNISRELARTVVG